MRVYFHLRASKRLRGSRRTIRDVKGVDVSHLEDARIETMRAVVDLLQEDAASAARWSGWSLQIADESKQVLFCLDLDGLTSRGRGSTLSLLPRT